MSKAELNLLNPPIVEAVLDIECDLPPGQQLTTLEAAARDCFRDHYPKYRLQMFDEHQIESRPGESVNVSMRQGVIALQFLQDDEKQLVQLRVQGFSFNRLSPYSSLDDYLPEIERSWRLYVQLASPVQIRLIRLRYINRMLIPMVDGRVELDAYFRVAPRLPDEERLVLAGFLHQNAAVEVKTGNQAQIVLTSQNPEGESLPVIFDNSVTSTEIGEPENWGWIASRIQTLRELKNHIFSRSLTDQCLNLFQQLKA